MKLLIYIFLASNIIFMSCLEKSQSEDLFKKIKPGMYKDEVIRILGKPDTVVYSIVDSSEYEFIYFSKKFFDPSLESSTVSFNSGRVEFSYRGE